ncbi:MAG: cytochrome C [Candidatus Hydrogenedentes bacterium]|nr:cytochrome C [Candidatus Hydrogenedentota bacterium]
MLDVVKSGVNFLANPPVLLTLILAGFFILFPINERCLRWNQRLGLEAIWTRRGVIIGGVLTTLFLLFGISDPNFRAVVMKPDNAPIVGLIYLVPFFLWLAMKQAVENDRRILDGKKPNEYHDPEDKVLVWPDLVYIELIALVLMTVFLVVWSLAIDAPLEGPANPTTSPNPAKAPWYFLALQEMLVYFDPWIAGVVLPAVIVLALMAIPYIDNNPKGQGYYSFRERKMAISLFLFCWLVIWILLIGVGTFLRGPNWNFFGPFEYWDVNKTLALNNVNLSEYIYVIGLGMELPKSIILREFCGILLLGAYFLGLPLLLARTWLNKLLLDLGAMRYSVFIMLTLIMFALPIKMYLRWLFTLKYILAIPEFSFNI